MKERKQMDVSDLLRAVAESAGRPISQRLAELDSLKKELTALYEQFPDAREYNHPDGRLFISNSLKIEDCSDFVLFSDGKICFCSYVAGTKEPAIAVFSGDSAMPMAHGFASLKKTDPEFHKMLVQRLREVQVLSRRIAEMDLSKSASA
jgi:hypothetical protein